MSDITLSKGVRQNLLTLQNTAELLGKTQERLATGRKVNSALDNPINFFTASGLTARSNDLSRLLDSVGNAIQTVQAADKGITAITKLIESAQATARQALTTAVPAAGTGDGDGDGDDVELVQATITSASSGVDYTDGANTLLGAGETATLTINGEELEVDDTTDVDALLAFINGIENLSAEVVDDELVITASNDASIEVGITGTNAAELATSLGIDDGASAEATEPTEQFAQLSGTGSSVDLTDGSNTVLGAGETATLTINGEDLSIDDTTDVDAVLAFINGLEGVSAEVVDDELVITAEEGVDLDLSITGTNAAEFAAAEGLETSMSAEYVPAPGGGDGDGDGDGDGAGALTGSALARSNMQANFNLILQQITELARDASFNGVNLINGDSLTVTFNEDGTSTLTIAGVDFTAEGLGLTTLDGSEFQTNAGINAAIAELDAATATLRSQASAFGSNVSIIQTRQDFTKNMINVLQIGADNLVLADSNEEGANMLALNTRQQLSTVALSLAAQADQNVLRLF